MSLSLPIELIYEIVQLNAFQLWRLYISQLNQEYKKIFVFTNIGSIIYPHTITYMSYDTCYHTFLNWRNVETGCTNIFHFDIKHNIVCDTAIKIPKNYL